MEVQKVTVYVLTAHGDDYHGSHTVAVYATKEQAKEELKRLSSEDFTCPTSETCDFRFWYTIENVDYYY